MNVYDFDGTIYRGDSTIDFYKYSVKKRPIIVLLLPIQLLYFILYKLKIVKKVRFKEVFYLFLKLLPDVNAFIDGFWKKNIVKIENWYLMKKKENDLIISASPEFLLSPICQYYNISLIASNVNSKTGIYKGENCYGGEKVIQFKRIYPIETIEEFYSDSLSDLPMAKLANESYLVNNGNIANWNY
ncbi:MAG: HAD-IB family phosphatase [Clostridia bacterium]